MSMATSHKIIEFFEEQIGPGKRFADRAALAEFLGVPRTQITKLYNFLNGADTQYKAVLGWIEKLGAKLDWPGEKAHDTTKDVCLVSARIAPAGEFQPPPQAEDYMAVPLVEEVGAGPGLIPQGELLSWFLVYKHQAAVRYRRNLIAVQIGKTSTSMRPIINPGDVVLVDLDDKDTNKPGRIMLVMDPDDGSGMIKRVAVENKHSDFRITFYSDNAAENPPQIFSWREDYGKDWSKVVAGHVIWAWSDISGK